MKDKEDQNIEDIVAEQIKLYRNDVSMNSHRIARIILRKIRKLLPTESEINSMAISTVNLGDSDTAKIIHNAAFEAGAKWAISKLSEVNPSAYS